MLFHERNYLDLALIIHTDWNGECESREEIRQLTLAARAEIAALEVVKLRTIHASYFIGTGKLKQIAEIVKDTQADLVIVNAQLSPSQERNLERAFSCRVIDRNRLILDIFAQRARSHEGKLQVELAQLEYMSTRLVRGWTHLERQKGGIGLRGPGESQLETDRRLLGNRVTKLKKQLIRVCSQRQQNRQNRQNIPTLAMVGYTNVGKSSMFNLLTDSTSYAADTLFATLDTSSRYLVVPGIGNCVLIDTVGFIKHLPHKLIEAFKATLEEITKSNLILHIVDASDKNYQDKINAVQNVLVEIGATEIEQLIIFNKIDQLDDQSQELLPPHVLLGEVRCTALQVSVHQRLGINQLLEAIAGKLEPIWYNGWLRIDAAQAGKISSQLHQLASVCEEKSSVNGDLFMRVQLPTSYINKYPEITLINDIKISIEHKS